MGPSELSVVVLLRKGIFCDILDSLGRLCLVLKWPINLFPFDSQPQGEDESPGFIENGSKERFYWFQDICIWAEGNYFWTVMALLPFKLIRRASSSGFSTLPSSARTICFSSSCLSRPLFPSSYGTHLSPLCEWTQKSDKRCSWLQRWLNAPSAAVSNPGTLCSAREVIH